MVTAKIKIETVLVCPNHFSNLKSFLVYAHNSIDYQWVMIAVIEL